MTFIEHPRIANPSKRYRRWQLYIGVGVIALLQPFLVVHESVSASGIGCSPIRTDDSSYQVDRQVGWQFPYASNVSYPSNTILGSGPSQYPTIGGVQANITTYANYWNNGSNFNGTGANGGAGGYDWQWVMLTNDLVGQNNGAYLAQVGPMTGDFPWGDLGSNTQYSLSGQNGTTNQSGIAIEYAYSSGQSSIFSTGDLASPSSVYAYKVLYNQVSDQTTFWYEAANGWNQIGSSPKLGWVPTQGVNASETHSNTDQAYGATKDVEPFTNVQIYKDTSSNSGSWVPMDQNGQATIYSVSASGSNPDYTTLLANYQFGWNLATNSELDVFDLGCPQTVTTGTQISPPYNFSAAATNQIETLDTHQGYYFAANTNGAFQVWENHDIYDASGCTVNCPKILWMPGGSSQSDYMTLTNGDLVVYGAQPSQTLWTSGISCTGSCNPTANIGPDGNLTDYNGSTLLWASYSNYVSAGNGITYGDELIYGQSISSPNGEYTLEMWSNGDLVLWNNATLTSPWSSVTTGGANSSACVSSTGYLQVWSGKQCTGSLEVQYGGTGSIDHLIVTNAGTVQLLQATDALVWQS